MKTTAFFYRLIAMMLCGTVLVQPTICAQQTEVFLKTKANAEKGFAEKYAAQWRDAMEQQMSPQLLAAAQKRTGELRAIFEAKLKSGGAFAQVTDSLLAAGERAFVGSYQLDNVLLGPGRLVQVHPLDPMFEGLGDMLEQAAKKSLLTAGQSATLRQADCTMQVHADHNFSITNLSAADFSRTVFIKGSWSLKVFQVLNTYGYRISMHGGPKGDLVLTKFLNADKPDPTIIEIIYEEGQIGKVSFRFTKINKPSPSSGL